MGLGHITGSDLLADGLEDAPHQIERRRRAAADDGIDGDHVRYHSRGC